LLSGLSILPKIIAKQLAGVPKIIGSIVVFNKVHTNHVKPPIIIADHAPKLELLLQKSPNVIGANMQTKIRFREATKRPTMSAFLKEK